MSKSLSRIVELPSEIGSDVVVDEHGPRGVITAWAFYGAGLTKAYVEWWIAGERRSDWFEAYRLTYPEGGRGKVGF